MKYCYNIIFDKSQDAWNWFNASRNPVFQGFAWRDQLSKDFLILFDTIEQMPDKLAKTEINVFLNKIYKHNSEFYNNQQKMISAAFSLKFKAACQWLEETTGKPLFFKDYTIYLTTFPRSPYDPDSGTFFFNIYQNEGLVNTFMHEVLHFQLIHYWQNDPKSAVSKLSKEDFDFLKESLTVIIDNDAIPPADFAETGYIPDHRDFRKKLHSNWQREHDFDKLIEYGLKILPDYI